MKLKPTYDTVDMRVPAKLSTAMLKYTFLEHGRLQGAPKHVPWPRLGIQKMQLHTYIYLIRKHQVAKSFRQTLFITKAAEIKSKS